ncbi:hypothetical protein ABIB29_002105 [Arthrobacter sp. UYEF36]
MVSKRWSQLQESSARWELPRNLEGELRAVPATPTWVVT